MAHNEGMAESLDYALGSKFTGSLSSFKLSSNLLYPTDGSCFTPYSIISTSTTGTTTTITTTLITTESTTTVPPGYVVVRGTEIASSSHPDKQPQYVDDGSIDTLWEPVTAIDAWVGIICNDNEET